MKTNNLNNHNNVIALYLLLMLPLFFSTIYPQKLSAETVPSFPAPTNVDIKKSPSKLSPLESNTNDGKLNDPQALNAIRTLIQGGIPVGQSKTQIMDNINPVSQYSGSSTARTNSNQLNASYRYVVKKGDTLNKIIKSTFNQHPLKMKSIAEAIIANNKKAFPTGKPTSMQAGATLVIPSFESITGMNSNGESSNLVIQKANPYVSTDPHRGWVRFP